MPNMGHLRELFDAPLAGPGLRGDTLLPVHRRRDGTAVPAVGPAVFDFDAGQPRDEHGKWTAAGAAGPATPFPAVASYARGRALAATVAAQPKQTTAAFEALKAANVAFKNWSADNPGGDEFGPERRAAFRAVEDAEKRFAAARDADRATLLAALPPVAPVKWAPDTSGCRPHGKNKDRFNEALAFVGRLVSEATGADPRVVVADGPDGPAYSPPDRDNPVGYIESPSRTGAATFAHEIGHHLEYAIPGAQKLCQEFLAHRTAGETPADLSALGLTQDSDAKGVKDDFGKTFGTTQCYYVGRLYSDGGTEILSMGIEALYGSPIHFAQSDPEYFAFVMGIVTGDLLGKGTSHAG